MQQETQLNNSRLVVDMGRLHHNVGALFKSLPAQTALIPVLKDDAYGLGLLAVGRAVASHAAVHTLAVAHVSEGVALRKAGIQKEVLVLGGMPGFLAAPAVRAGLTLAVGRSGLLPLLARQAQRLGTTAKVEIKIETGLNRIGFAPGRELDALITEWQQCRAQVEVCGAFSHFANVEDEARTKNQYDLFMQGAAQLEAAGIVLNRRHLCGSAAAEQLPQYSLDAVRIGRGLYMDHPTQPRGNVLEVPSWQSWITGLRQLSAGQTLGYGAGFALERETPVATVGVGYGDGLDPALAAAHAPVLVRGQTARLLATCMDQCFVDVTGISCRPDDTVTFFGQDGQGGFLSSQAVALLIGDNEGCGLTSALSPRVARVYVEE